MFSLQKWNQKAGFWAAFRSWGEWWWWEKACITDKLHLHKAISECQQFMYTAWRGGWRGGVITRQIPENCHHSLSMARGFDEGLFDLLKLFLHRDQWRNTTTGVCFTYPKNSLLSQLKETDPVCSLSNLGAGSEGLWFAWQRTSV